MVNSKKTKKIIINLHRPSLLKDSSLQLAKTMQPAGPSSPRSQLTHGMINGPIPPWAARYIDLFSLQKLFFLSFLNFRFFTVIDLREGYEFVKLVREYKNGEVYDRLMQILKDYVEQRFFLISSAFFFYVKIKQ